MRTLLQQFHRWRLGLADSQPLELPNRAVVNRRYEILCQLGQGTVERTYLAADHFYNESWCVLKEFVPRLLNARALSEGREQFEQEVSLLRDLEHPQLPEFREVIECQYEGLNRWIVVQEWLEGMSYVDQVKSRPFSETEVIQFLHEVLPVLNYLHQQDPPVIHGNLSAETILQSSEMQKPILINFGTLKQIALAIADPYADPVPPRLELYRPPEQLRGAPWEPSMDLYALAATALTLLTGCPDPREFYDRKRREWKWAEYVGVSVGLVVILDRMLHRDPAMRYASGVEVQAALEAIHSRLPVPKPQTPTHLLQPPSKPVLAQPTPVELSVNPSNPQSNPQSLITQSAEANSLNPAGTGGRPNALPGRSIGLSLPPAPSLVRVNQTVTVAVRQACSMVIGGIQRSGSGMRSQLMRLRRISPQKAASFVLGSLFWLVLGGFTLLTLYTGFRLSRWLNQDSQGPEVAESVRFSVQPRRSQAHSRFLRSRDLDRCEVSLSSRMAQLEAPSWAEVDDEFQIGFPNFEGPIKVNNPDHAFYLQEWCYLANRWLTQQGIN